MPSFTHPLALWLLVLVPPLLYLWQCRGRAALRYADVNLVTGLPPGRSRRAIWGGILLRGAGLALLILALAGPRWPDPGTREPTEGIAIAMVVDVSASMNERDFIWQDQVMTRLEGVKKVFGWFVSGGDGPGGEKLAPRPQDLISLITFATRPDTACPLTHDHKALLKILESEQPRTIATEATTNPGDAIAWALASLQNAPARRKVLIFLTDGESNVGKPALSPRQAAQLAGNLSIPIYAIGAGPDFGEGVAPAPRQTMEDVARISKGHYFGAGDGPALVRACQEIDQLERSRIKTFSYRHYHEGFAWCALLAFVSWLTVVSLENTRWRRIP
jgi:Ca-activated chloride channel family protein